MVIICMTQTSTRWSLSAWHRRQHNGHYLHDTGVSTMGIICMTDVNTMVIICMTDVNTMVIICMTQTSTQWSLSAWHRRQHDGHYLHDTDVSTNGIVCITQTSTRWHYLHNTDVSTNGIVCMTQTSSRWALSAWHRRQHDRHYLCNRVYCIHVPGHTL